MREFDDTFSWCLQQPGVLGTLLNYEIREGGVVLHREIDIPVPDGIVRHYMHCPVNLETGQIFDQVTGEEIYVPFEAEGDEEEGTYLTVTESVLVRLRELTQELLG